MNKKFEFSKLEYVRPDFEVAKNQLVEYSKAIKEAKNYQIYKNLILEYDEWCKEIDLQCTLAFIHMYLDCTDVYYQEEVAKVQEGSIWLDHTSVNQVILESPFVKQLEGEFGKELIVLLHKENKVKGSGKELQVKAEQLVNQYQQSKASLQIEFEGKNYSEAELNKLNQSQDRDVRKQVKIAYYETLLTQKKQWEEILDELVQTRISLAQANGYESYLEYMNEEKGRRGYGEKELNAFSAQVKQELVPLLRKLSAAQAKRIGVNELHIYDQALIFKDGNEQHVGGAGLLEAAEKMYHGLSQEIGKFYDEMMEQEVIDIQASPHKIANMGFCTLLASLKTPYVFGNSNNTPSDVAVLTHEIGHAYQGYLSMKKQPHSLYYNQVNDIAEIPSKTMEQFSYEYAEDFFGETKDKYLFHHQQMIIDEICAYCASNEFENYLYTYPEATMEERISRFNAILIEYGQISAEDELNRYFDKGVLLFRHMGVYMFPKYLISYAVSAMSACEFRTKMDQDRAQAWADYEKLCEAGGSLSYKELLEIANLSVPFEEGAVRKCTQSLRTSLEKYLKN